MTTLIIVRHGQSEANLMKTFAGQSDVRLTELGLRQAQAAAEYLKDCHLDAVYSSPLSRAYETAVTIIGDRGIEIICDAGLCETKLGDWEGLKIESVREEYTRWRNEFNYAPPNGESTYSVRERSGKTLDKIARENNGKTVLIAGHGGWIRLLPSYYDNNNDELIRTTPIASNVSITTIIWENGVGKIKEYAFDEYLGNMITQFDNGN